MRLPSIVHLYVTLERLMVYAERFAVRQSPSAREARSLGSFVLIDLGKTEPFPQDPCEKEFM